MQTSQIVQTIRNAGASTRRSGISQAVPGMCCGFLALTCLHLYIAGVGTSLVVATVGGLVAAAAVDCGLWRSTPCSPRARVTTFVALTAWISALPWLSEITISGVGSVMPESDLSAITLAAVAALEILGVPLFLAVRLLVFEFATGGPPKRDQLPRILDSGLMWFAIGALVDVFLVAPAIGVQTAALAALVVAAIPIIVLRDRGIAIQDADTVRTEISPKQSMPATSKTGMLAGDAPAAVATVCCGAAAAIIVETLRQLVPNATYVFYASVGSMAFSLSLGFRNPDSRTKSDPMNDRIRARAARSCLAVGLWLACIVASCEVLIRGLLLANAYVSSPLLLGMIRAGLFAAGLAPIGFAWGRIRCASGRATVQREFAAPRTTMGLMWFAGGFALTRWLYVGGFAFQFLLAGVTTLVVAEAFIFRHMIRDRRHGNGLVLRVSLAGGVAAIAAAPWIGQLPDPERAARLLFSTHVFRAERAAVPSEMLSVLDESRLIDTAVSERGILTIWRRRACQLQMRENGVPRGVVSSMPQCCPQYSAETATAVMPLIFHSSPERILVLGLGGGLPVATALGFPVRAVTCAESDAVLCDLVRRHIWQTMPVDPVDDDRLTLIGLDAPLALTVGSAKFDVIISNPPPTSLLRTVPELTTTYYQRAARRLTAGGVFCQRFRIVDYGPRPLADLACTIQSVFRNVLALQVAAGDILFLATNSADGFATEHLSKRLRLRHVRSALADAGWDWSGPLDLAFIDNASLQEFVEKNGSSINSVDNGRFAFSLPAEEMRWGDKRNRLRMATEAYTRRTISLVSNRDDRREALTRITEMNEQSELISGFVDRPWVYRRSLRSRLKQHPRPPVQVVENGQVVQARHPTDQRRLDYFESLSAAVKTSKPVVERVQAVGAFARPFDPILGHFVHHEAADLYARLDDRIPAVEYTHRLHAIYFSQLNDRSVSNVIAAMELQEPQILSDAGLRYDHLNSLLQMLTERWQTRRDVAPESSHIVLNDICKSMEAMDSAFRTLPIWAVAAGVDQQYTRTRTRYLETYLVRPLRTYRQQVIAHVERTRAIAEKNESTMPAPLSN